ncbi:hypothetical protein PINS_up006875 [Pythium insidiosum]|nr:hypothetical protein PINS_up006875 [Pythium insidiosum]
MSNKAGLYVGISLAVLAVLIIAGFTAWRIHQRHQDDRVEPRLTSGDADFAFVPMNITVKKTTAPKKRRSLPTHSKAPSWVLNKVLLRRRVKRRELEIGRIIERDYCTETYQGSYHGNRIAVRQLNVQSRCNIDTIAELAKEALFLASLYHPHIVTLVGVAWNAPSDLCIVTEYLTGGNLRSLLDTFSAERRPTGFSQDKLKIALHVARALAYLHNQDPVVAHHNLTSKNILLTEDGDAKLKGMMVPYRDAADFDDAAAARRSLLYVAPELVHGVGYDEKADIYSFGVVLSELDTNELPFAHARSEDDSSRRLPHVTVCHLVSEGELTVEFSSSADARLVALGRACVSMDPRARPSALELVDVLDRFCVV